MPSSGPVYEIKITLQDSRPPIWRRVQLPASITLSKLHRVLQIVMGWEDCHLHLFTAGGARYGVPDPDDWAEVKSERAVPLSRILQKPKDRLDYEYDFGDAWALRVVVEKILPDQELKFPVCVAGKRAGPPEDSGGVWGYEETLEIVRDPQHPEHEDRLEWLGDDFDPEEFDLEAVNQELRRLR